MNYYVSALELAAFIASLLTIKKGLVFQLLSFILLATVLTEWWLVPVLSQKDPFNPNKIYNAFSLLDISAWTTIFFFVHKQSRWRFFVLISYGLTLTYSLIEILVLKNWHSFHTDSMRLYSLCIILFASGFFYSKLRLPYYRLTADPIFWICCAAFFFHSVLFVTLTTQSQPEYFNFPNAERFFFILLNISNTLYYGLLIVSFLVCYLYSYNKAQG